MGFKIKNWSHLEKEQTVERKRGEEKREEEEEEEKKKRRKEKRRREKKKQSQKGMELTLGMNSSMDHMEFVD